jgi:hypothetical protein
MSCGLEHLYATVEACAIASPDEGPVDGGEWLVQMTGSLVGAAAGALLAYFGQARFVDRRDRSAFRARRDEATGELKTLAEETARRADRGGKTIEFDAPLPTGAWNRLLDGGHRDRLPAELATDIEKLYSDIYGVNASASQIGAVLQVAMLGDDGDQRKAFRDQLVRITTESYGGLADRASELADRLAEVEP